MYLPSPFVESDQGVVRDLVRRVGFGHLVAVDGTELVSTPVPFLVDETLSSVRAHLARPNPLGRLDGCPALLIVPVSDAYISPGWYPSKTEHGRVVPTWNYEIVHLHGSIQVHDDTDWLRAMVTDLTDHHEASQADPWAVTDAPSDFVDNLLRSIVGVELLVHRVEAKRKLGQNREPADVLGAVDGLEATSSARPGEVAAAMRDEAVPNSGVRGGATGNTTP